MNPTSLKIKESLMERLRCLERIQRNKERAMKRAPEGKLRINNRKSGPQYYYRRTQKDKIGVYLPRKDIILAKRLGQKDYDERILRAVNKEILAIRKCLSMYPDASAEEIYESLSVQRRSLVNPIELTDEGFAEYWSREAYERKTVPDPEEGFSTDHGEIVRSKSEWIIANLLERYKVPYRYESKLLLEGFGTVFPDFNILNVRERRSKYWEHEGMMDDPEYAESAIRKERAYIRNGYMPGDNLILTSETRKQPLNPDIVKEFIERYCL